MREEKILVVDDDPSIRRLVWKSLQSTGLLIYQAETIEKTQELIQKIDFDLFLLDVSLVNENDGFHLSRMIREQNPVVPIIFISGRKSDQDIVVGLEAGADYYLTKPFSPSILRAQVISTMGRNKTITESVKPPSERIIHLGKFTFDKKKMQFLIEDKEVPLSSRELKLMQFFMEHPDQVFSKKQIYQHVWDENVVDGSEEDDLTPSKEKSESERKKEEADLNNVMVYMNYLRNKIEVDPKKPIYLKTVWGIGYTFIPEDDSKKDSL